jgi:hypothetical protein
MGKSPSGCITFRFCIDNPTGNAIIKYNICANELISYSIIFSYLHETVMKSGNMPDIPTLQFCTLTLQPIGCQTFLLSVRSVYCSLQTRVD